MLDDLAAAAIGYYFGGSRPKEITNWQSINIGTQSVNEKKQPNMQAEASYPYLALHSHRQSTTY